MCGIAGIVDLAGEREIDRDALTRMTNALTHRGPDGEGFFIRPGLGFGHRRLAIIDLVGGVQPFVSGSRDGVLTFNGEIYNYTELADELRGNGANLRTRSDTEVLTEGLARDGAQYISRLRGMFAFGFWDARAQTLTLSRDRLGERPLYYAETTDGFLIFASELGAIIASGLVSLDFDHQALADYFLYGFIPDPKSVYKAIRKLPPATALIAKRGKTARLQRYWSLEYSPLEEVSFETAQDELIARLDDAVLSQMIADVPLGAFLSGGVDSSGVVASMAETGVTVKTCSIGFDEDSHDERQYARLVAKLFRTDHVEDVATLDAAALIDDIARIYGEPFADASALPTYLVSKLARRHVTVALSGDGGDEIFAGYRRHKFFLQEERIRAMVPEALRRATFGIAGAFYPKLDWAPRPLRLKTTLQSLGQSRGAAYAHAIAANLPNRTAHLLAQDFKKSLGGYRAESVVEEALGLPSDHPLVAAERGDLAAWLPGRMLTKVDRAAMANSLEVRPPLLDYKLVEWAARLKPAYKLQDGNGKRILKAALERRLPSEILYRPKQGFALPVADWLRAEGGPLSRLNASEAWRKSGVLDTKAVEAMAKAHKASALDASQELWSVIMFDAFLQQASKLP